MRSRFFLFSLFVPWYLSCGHLSQPFFSKNHVRKIKDLINFVVTLYFLQKQPRRGEILIDKALNTTKLQGSVMLFTTVYAAPLELDPGVDALSINVPLLTELFRVFQKTKVFHFVFHR